MKSCCLFFILNKKNAKRKQVRKRIQKNKQATCQDVISADEVLGFVASDNSEEEEIKRLGMDLY